jgi:hypothetical protein
VDPLDPNTHQEHDNNPGITASGLLWTIRAPANAVQANWGAGVAHYGMTNVPMADYGTLANALFGRGVGVPGPSTPSVVSWSLHWGDVLSTGSFRDDGVGFAMDYKQTRAHLEWSMRTDRFTFTARGDHQFVPAFGYSLIASERNGVFF